MCDMSHSIHIYIYMQCVAVAQGVAAANPIFFGVAVRCSGSCSGNPDTVLRLVSSEVRGPVIQYVTMCCSICQCVAVCCSVLQSGVCCSICQCVAVCCSVLQSGVCCSAHSQECCVRYSTTRICIYIYIYVSCCISRSILASVHCNTLHSATHCNTLQRIGKYCNTLHSATHCNTLQRIGKYCNTL